jgi:hypothetical protein
MALNRKDIRTASNGVCLEHRHFAFIAATLRASRPEHHWDANKMAQWDVTVNRFADACAATNPKFNRARFLSACTEEC